MATDPATAFNAMAAAYDELEPWYEHLYAVLHDVLRASLAPPEDGRPRLALDAGCGTGFQTAILLDLGYGTVGADLSASLLAIARRRHPAACFARGDVETLPWRSGVFDAAVSCGSVLSFVSQPARVIGELARVLRPGGQLLVEVEHRWSLDLLWRLASSVAGDALGYGVGVRDAGRAFAPPLSKGIWIDYPGYPPLRLFTRSELKRLLGEAGLVPLRAWGLHSMTNVIPSTVLHRGPLGRATGALYRRLRPLDRALAATRPGRWLANSLVVLAVKPSNQSRGRRPTVDGPEPRAPAEPRAARPGVTAGPPCAAPAARLG